jgi:hypothetical protein
MANATRKLSYEQFAEHLPDVLDELARAQDIVLFEKDGKTFRVELAEPELDPRLPPLLPLETRLRILRETAGSFHTPDREAFLAYLREARGQDSEGRPG